MSDIFIEKTNNSFITLYIDDEGIREHIYEHFRYNQPQFSSSKFRKWDGVVRLFNKSTSRLPYGLLNVLLLFCNEHKYSVETDPAIKNSITDIDKDALEDWVSTLDLHTNGQPLIPYEYQIEAFFLAVKFNRLTALAATSAGKSLIIYMLMRFYDEIGYDAGRTLIIVPSIGLVTQLFNDFVDYSSANKWDVSGNCHKIAEGAERISRKPIFISTWQSLLDMPDDYFHQFANIIVDECHLSSGKSLTNICNAAINASRRIGLTGTLNGTELHELQVGGLLGPIVRIVTTKQLQDAGRAAKTLVTMMYLNYGTEDRKQVSKLSYQDELDFLIEHPYRNKIIKSLAEGLSGNSLFLFNRREKHLEKLYEELVALNLPNKKFFMIVGGVSGDDREEIKRLIEASEEGVDCIVFATAKTTSTGWSVKKLHNLVFCFPTKSVVTTLQSIGRLLRLHSTKDIANIFDLVDNLEYSSKKNFALSHAFERYGFYSAEGHEIALEEIKMKSFEGL